MTEGTRTHCIWQPTEQGKYALTEAIVFPSVVLHNHSLPVLVSHKSQPSACSWHEKTAVSGLLFYSCSQILDAHASLKVTFLKQWCLSICLIFPTAYICLHLTSVCRAHVEKFWSQDIFSKCTTSGISSFWRSYPFYQIPALTLPWWLWRPTALPWLEVPQ